MPPPLPESARRSLVPPDVFSLITVGAGVVELVRGIDNPYQLAALGIVAAVACSRHWARAVAERAKRG